jgi:hypothetical protein
MTIYLSGGLYMGRTPFVFVFEKNVLNLLGNALENFQIFPHEMKVVCIS